MVRANTITQKFWAVLIEAKASRLEVATYTKISSYLALLILKSHQQHPSRYPLDQRPVRGYSFFRLLIFGTVMSYGTKTRFHPNFILRPTKVVQQR
ncbi:hypothetical protein AKN88_05780 [Thiopseudomonas alkaliphila]|uniref:Uncharacterized protein n=1 Tax=Thiopseudomonas alkaliphila TaxID=1697053 RepID=A0A0K1XE96_9GAMM|nr:hypothetical protein AKN88_05780 [Thiopseudomonas alkaliphila]